MKILLPFGWAYGGAVLVRNTLFNWGVLKQESIGVPVISVGNLTVGGTGKTPLVEYIVGHLLERGCRVAVVSRGYKRKSKGVVVVSDGKNMLADVEQAGDEPFQIAARFRDVIVVVGERRVDAARQAVRLGAEVVVLDDGFQHRYLNRDLDVVVVDSTKDPTRDAVLPAGRLREGLSGLRRAHLLAFSRADEGQPEELAAKLRAYFDGPSIRFRYGIKEVRRVNDDAEVSADAVRRMRLVAMSGIGNHEAFIQRLHADGFMTEGEMRFADHHRFSDLDFLTITSYTKALPVDALLTTEKDAVRLRADAALCRTLCDELPVFYVRIKVEILGGKETLHELMAQTLRGKQ